MRFKGLDLNLLVALDTLVETRSVSRSAERMNLSQPAMSSALGRLRDYFGDPILRRPRQAHVSDRLCGEPAAAGPREPADDRDADRHLHPVRSRDLAADLPAGRFRLYYRGRHRSVGRSAQRGRPERPNRDPPPDRPGQGPDRAGPGRPPDHARGVHFAAISRPICFAKSAMSSWDGRAIRCSRARLRRTTSTRPGMSASRWAIPARPPMATTI